MIPCVQVVAGFLSVCVCNLWCGRKKNTLIKIKFPFTVLMRKPINSNEEPDNSYRVDLCCVEFFID